MMRDKYDYGECEICDTPLREKYIRQSFQIRGEVIVIDNVLAGVCPQCGEKIVRAEVGHHIAELLQDTEVIAKATRITVPLLSLGEYTSEKGYLRTPQKKRQGFTKPEFL